MMNTFKNVTLINVSNSSYVDLYTCPASTQTVVLGLAIANKTTNAVTVQVQFQDTSASNATFQLLENKYPNEYYIGNTRWTEYFGITDILKVKIDTASAIDVVMV